MRWSKIQTGSGEASFLKDASIYFQPNTLSIHRFISTINLVYLHEEDVLQKLIQDHYDENIWS